MNREEYIEAEYRDLARPMLAEGVESLDLIPLPAYVTPKLDGFRCLRVNGQVLSRSFKPIQNLYIRQQIASLPDGLDGEIMVPGVTFSELQSIVNTASWERVEFTYNVFDRLDWATWNEMCAKAINVTYAARVDDLAETDLPEWCVKVLPRICYTLEELVEAERYFVEECGYEGICTRTAESLYKEGRSTLREAWLLKYKRFVDAEAEVIGVEELMHNNNPKQTSEIGLSKRSSHKANKTPGGTMGKLLVRDLATGVEFKIGTGFTNEDRAGIWIHRQNTIGLVLTYRYQPEGVKDKPRFPSFKGWRSAADRS